MADQDRIDHILNNLIKLASGDFNIKDLSQVKNDSLDAIDRGIFMLGEQLKVDQERNQQLLSEKETLLRETHHRVKNNLQIITSLMNLQMGYLNDESISAFARQTQNRINSMAMIHELLYQKNDLKKIDYRKYLNQLILNLIQSTNEEDNIEFIIDVRELLLNVDTAIPLGLIVNEIITNSIKYAFVGKNEGALRVKITELEYPNFVMEIGDNGIGFSNETKAENSESLGLNLIHILSKQLGGSVEQDSTKQGTNYIIRFQEAQ